MCCGCSSAFLTWHRGACSSSVQFACPSSMRLLRWRVGTRVLSPRGYVCGAAHWVLLRRHCSRQSPPRRFKKCHQLSIHVTEQQLSNGKRHCIVKSNIGRFGGVFTAPVCAFGDCFVFPRHCPQLSRRAHGDKCNRSLPRTRVQPAYTASMASSGTLEQIRVQSERLGEEPPLLCFPSHLRRNGTFIPNLFVAVAARFLSNLLFSLPLSLAGTARTSDRRR